MAGKTEERGWDAEGVGWEETQPKRWKEVLTWSTKCAEAPEPRKPREFPALHGRDACGETAPERAVDQVENAASAGSRCAPNESPSSATKSRRKPRQ
ncbi:hypothetical protein AOLI_G00267470 [Acnodon oligacanthus]